MIDLEMQKLGNAKLKQRATFHGIFRTNLFQQEAKFKIRIADDFKLFE